MSRATIWLSPVNDEYNEVVMIDRIRRLSKESQDVTLVHLVNGEVLRVEDSINSLECRLEVPTIRHCPVDSDYEELIIVSWINRLNKESGDVTLIHMDGNEVIRSEDSMKTLDARINSALEEAGCNG